VADGAFKREYDALRFPNDESLWRAWCEARTGYPLVDAAMHQINHTGYMHNRLRMVVASFLVKDLGIDWRWGERYFAEKLNDFDLAANNGGWQWASSSGCDAQPYFRIFNPISQSEKFDPEGQVVRSEQKQNEKSTTVGAGGVPGVASNLPGKTTVAATPSQGQSEKQSQTVNYEMTKITSRTVNAPGLVKKLTAAVLVDGIYTPQQGSKEMKYTPRSEEDVRRYEELVRETVGFTESRGDQIKIVNMPFEVVAREEEALPPKTQILEMAAPAARYALPLLSVILLVVFVLRPLALSMSVPGSNLPANAGQIAQTFAEIEKTGARKELPPRAQVADWARKNPTDAANVIKGWMR
jgi:hypothetical protein